MNVAVQTEFKADRKEPLGTLIRRVADAFQQNGLTPEITASFSDGAAGTTSAVARALKKHPHLARFERSDAPPRGVPFPAIRRLSGDPPNTFELADVLLLADGVPRSLPFNAVIVHFGHEDFGRSSGFPPRLAPQPGIAIGDNWWVNGRTRSLSAFYIVEGDAKAAKLPPPPPAIGAILASFGKPRRSKQFVPPLAVAPPGAPLETAGPVSSGIAAVAPIVAKYRSSLKAMIERIGLPNDLPPAADVLVAHIGARGPLKPVLVEVFAGRGYDCRGESGIFTLRRRTATNLVIDIELDVGTWSRSLTWMFHVRGPGFNATLVPPVTTRDEARQYPIGDSANWTRIVENMAAVVDELERTFVPEIEAAVPPTPAWFEPGR